MAERKVRMWGAWHKDGSLDPRTMRYTREAARLAAFGNGWLPSRVVRVEVREVKARKSGKGKVKRGR